MRFKEGKLDSPFHLDNDDKWLSADKFQHLFACMIIVLFGSQVATRFKFLQQWRVPIGTLLGLSAGFGKEALDLMGVNGSKASFKDLIADVIGVIIALVFFYFCRESSSSSLIEQVSQV